MLFWLVLLKQPINLIPHFNHFSYSVLTFWATICTYSNLPRVRFQTIGDSPYVMEPMNLFKLGNPPGSQDTWLILFYVPLVSCLLQPQFALSLCPGITFCVALSDSLLSFWAVNNTDFCFSSMQVSVCCVPPSKESWNLMKQRGVYVPAQMYTHTYT